MQHGARTPTRQKVLSYIQFYEKKHGFCPTVREIGSAVGLKSTSSVYGHLQRLKREGLISAKERCPRTISADKKAVAVQKKQSPDEGCTYIQCGFPIPPGAKVVTIVATLLDRTGNPISVQASDVASINSHE